MLYCGYPMKKIFCWLGFHQIHEEYDEQGMFHLYACERCGADVIVRNLNWKI